MTIKNRGGVFGRNPTFNDVDVDGTLTVGGNAVPAANTILVDGDIGVTVQAYDAATAKTNVSQTFTALQNFNFAGGGNYVATFQTTSTSTPYTVNIGETSGSAAGYPLFRVGQSYSPYSDYFRVNSQGNVYATGGVYIGGTAAANELSDYEEGVWTPTLVGNTSAGTYSIAASGCTYTKVGRLVTVMGKMTITVTSAGSGLAKFGGLPFTTSGDAVAIGTAVSKNVDLDNSTISLAFQPWTSNTTEFAISSVRDNSTTATLDVSGISTGDFIIINTTYIT